ncbi:uncharacterized protein [Mytilus edulis]|uniref:HIG1 domain-containing protein n=1 Tax=Mytilus edulis TaxID=6550 RepID=A0A8S3QF66_MYTED|nr:unnamed protein product [Mytilus edulis]
MKVKRKSSEDAETNSFQYIPPSVAKADKLKELDSVPEGRIEPGTYEPPPDFDNISEEQKTHKPFDLQFARESWGQIKEDPYGPSQSMVWEQIKTNPLVPIGFSGMVFSFVYGMYQNNLGNAEMANKMMRYRVYASAFTMAALFGGTYYQFLKFKWKKAEFERIYEKNLELNQQNHINNS